MDLVDMNDIGSRFKVKGISSLTADLRFRRYCEFLQKIFVVMTMDGLLWNMHDITLTSCSFSLRNVRSSGIVYPSYYSHATLVNRQYTSLMNSTLIQMTLLMACGVGWRLLRPGGLSAEQTRLVLTTFVYYLLLPAMVLDVLWTAEIGMQSFQYTILGIGCIVFAMLCMWMIGTLFKFEDKRLGAMILAAAFPNVTYLGLPVLEQTFGSWARSVVIQMDLFATSPFLFTVGIMVVRHYGEDNTEKPKSVLAFLNAPPFWAAADCGYFKS